MKLSSPGIKLLKKLLFIIPLVVVFQNCGGFNPLLSTTLSSTATEIPTQPSGGGSGDGGQIAGSIDRPLDSTLPFLVGFFAGSVEGNGMAIGDGGSPSINYDYMNSVAPLSNVIVLGSSDIDDVVVRVRRAAGFGKKSIIMLQYLLYPWKVPLGAAVGTPSAQTFVPDPAYQTIFDLLWKSLGDQRSNIAGFYIFDEPYKNNFCAGTPSNSACGTRAGPNNMVSTAAVRAGLDQVINYIKLKSSAPTLMVFSPDVEVSNSQFASVMLPPLLDMYGVDCYLEFGPICSEAAVNQLVMTMKAARRPNQKLIFVMDGTGPVTSDLNLNLRNRLWSRIIGDNINITGMIMPFIYENSPQDEVTGLQSLPLALEAISIYAQGYMDIVSCQGQDLANKVNSQVWKDAPYCQPTCEAGNLVQRSIKGIILQSMLNSPRCQN
jgi:hypothetical protein